MICPESFSISRSGPATWPRANRKIENGCMMQMLSSRFILDKHALKDQCCGSTKAGYNDAPRIMCAVD